MLLATLRQPPRAGSLQEKVLLQYTLLREQAEHAKFRALAQSVIDKEKAVEVFEEYMKVAFPWVEKAVERKKEIATAVMEREFRGGALKVTALRDPRPKTSAVVSRLSRRVETPKKKYGVGN